MSAEEKAYLKAANICFELAKKWKEDNPDAKLKFNPPVSSSGVMLIGMLDLAVHYFGVAGNDVTKEFLMTLHKGTPNGATINMAEYAIEQLYGIPAALTQKKH